MMRIQEKNSLPHCGRSSSLTEILPSVVACLAHCPAEVSRIIYIYLIKIIRKPLLKASNSNYHQFLARH